MINILRPLATAMLALGLCAAAHAATLTIGSSTEPASIDPLFSRTGNNQNIAQQVFDRLVDSDLHMQIKPGLAISWSQVAPLIWQIKLRKGVKFHDGANLTAEDVIFSLNRAKNVPNSPAPFSGNVAAIDSISASDPLTLLVHTKQPTPDLMEQIGFVYILEKKVAENASVEDYNSGKAAIGTGAYRFREWVPSDHLSLERNDAYWGGKRDFDKVMIRFISSDASRVAALRSGAVDLIDAVPPGDVKSLSEIKGLKLFSVESARLIYLALDSSRDDSPFVTDNDGKPMNKNPLKDVRVRRALSALINRPLLIRAMLDGAGTPAGQLVPPGVAGHDPASLPTAYDPALAKKLLEAAGYPKGFGLSLHTSNDRFPGDAKIAQALAQMFARGGLRINKVSAEPYNVYTKNASNQAFSAFVFSLGNTTPTSQTGMRNLLMSFDKESGAGIYNRTRYSNPKLDAAISKAMQEPNFAERVKLLQTAAHMAFEDFPVLPLYWQKVYWAGKSHISFTGNMGEYTTATLTSLAK